MQQRPSDLTLAGAVDLSRLAKPAAGPAAPTSTSPHVFDVAEADFEDLVLRRSLQVPVLVDFWAEWCGPCKMIAPALDQIAREYEGRLKVAKLNIDENPVTPPKYSVRGIPTLMLFKNGSLEAQKVGALSKTQLAAFIDSNI